MLCPVMNASRGIALAAPFANSMSASAQLERQKHGLDNLALQAANAVHSLREISMKYSKALLVSALVAMSSVAFAQAGGNGNGGAGGGGSAGSGNNAAHDAASAGSTSGAMSASGSKTHHMSKSKAKTKKPMSDSTNTPGADASSGTNGQ